MSPLLKIAQKSRAKGKKAKKCTIEMGRVFWAETEYFETKGQREIYVKWMFSISECMKELMKISFNMTIIHFYFYDRIYGHFLFY